MQRRVSLEVLVSCEAALADQTLERLIGCFARSHLRYRHDRRRAKNGLSLDISGTQGSGKGAGADGGNPGAYPIPARMVSARQILGLPAGRFAVPPQHKTRENSVVLGIVVSTVW